MTKSWALQLADLEVSSSLGSYWCVTSSTWAISALASRVLHGNHSWSLHAIGLLMRNFMIVAFCSVWHIMIVPALACYYLCYLSFQLGNGRHNTHPTHFRVIESWNNVDRRLWLKIRPLVVVRIPDFGVSPFSGIVLDDSNTVVICPGKWVP